MSTADINMPPTAEGSNGKTGIGSHANAGSGSDEWLTPPSLLRALGPFDLDPCAPAPGRRPWDIAAKHYDASQNGLLQPWTGRVWLNPPYSQADRWLSRLADHGRGLALIFARTETRLWFEQVWPRAHGILFLQGRLTFHTVLGKPGKANSGGPSALVAYGMADAALLADYPVPGHFVPLAPSPMPGASIPDLFSALSGESS